MDSIFQTRTGKSVIKYIYDDHRLKSDDFSDLFYTHPSIFMVEVALARMMVSKGIRPYAVIGSSLGEYAAGVVADVWRPEDALDALIEQVDLFKKFSQRGGMMVILARPPLYDEDAILHHHAEIAAINNESHFVISSNQEGLDTVERYLSLQRITYLRLPVKVPFRIY
ncbi:acyltransferase domain-containing protein [Paenibacillus sp. NPDC055715]